MSAGAVQLFTKSPTALIQLCAESPGIGCAASLQLGRSPGLRRGDTISVI